MAIGRYAVAVVAVGVAILVRLPLQPALGGAVPYLLFVPAIAATAWYAGIGPGLLSTALSAATAAYWLLPMANGWPWSGQATLLSVPLFLTVGAFISWIAESWRRAQQRLESERATLAATLLSIGEGVIVADAGGRVAMMNGVAEALTGWAATQARGHAVDEVFRIRDERADAPVDPGGGAPAADDPATGSTVLVGREGRRWPIDHTAAPVSDARHERVGTVIVFREVSQRRRVEAEREAALGRERDARREAESANRVKDEFLATISHELRTPLNAILGWSRMLTQGSVPRGRQDHAIAVIHRNAEAQKRLVEDLLDIARFVTGKMRLAFERVDLLDVVGDAVEAVRVAAEAKQIPITVQAEAAIAPVAGDPARLRQLVWNLVSNAVKFTPAGGRIAIRLERDGANDILHVSDTGVGIVPELLPRIFDRFTQADSSAARVDGGLGLGLALVRQIAEAHGGGVRVESAGPGQGSTFAVTLPVFAGEAAEAPDPPPAEPAPAAREEPVGPLTHVRVLVVEDDADGRELTRVVLAGCGADVRDAESANEAIRVLNEWRPDVIVTDIGMPEQDGVALRRRLVAEGLEEVPTIALTGYAGADDRQRLLAAGFVAHLAKPIDADALTGAIAEALRRAHDPAQR
jgi:PAS domain S-box-containing protein